MKRLHIHVGVPDLDQGIAFYNKLFASEPSRVESDYAKWMLEDPKINFAISTRVSQGVDHLGIQVDEAAEMDSLRENLQSADMALFDEGETVCCYAKSDKAWVRDPAGVAWETFHSMADVALFSGKQEQSAGANCCAPGGESAKACC
jgi:lactoylglutathione lyase